ncbi:MAG: hypothetical protein KC656_26770, partial [Myxococcales bacterium]|nr:hypothetical protein [Myxococcales bacterium]
AETIVDPFALHFMEKVSSIDFGARDTFGTCQDSRNTYNGQAPPNDFSGPTLWSSDPEIFGISNPEAVAFLTDQFGMPTDLGSHLDMLHESPLCMGIAWETDNVYWVFDGKDGAIVRYDFQEDHGPGYDDHSDGIISRFASGSVSRVSGTVSHLAWDHDRAVLYIADSGNGRVAVLDPSGAERGEALRATEPGTDHHRMKGARPETLVDGASVGLDRPAGLELLDDRLVVTDAADGQVFVFETDGTLVGTLETGLGADALAGVTGSSLDDLWIVDAKGDRVHRLAR